MTCKFRRLSLFLILTLLVAGWICPAAAAEIKHPEISSPAAYLVDLKTGTVLASKDAESQRAVASTTKIMTALLTLEKADLDSDTVISEYAARTEGAVIDLEPGETRGVGELLNALMVASANDAAVALAEHIAGTETGFSDLMNARANQLGAHNTHFVNPHGLAAGHLHYSSAKDLGTIAFAAMKRSDFRRLVVTRRFTWDTTDTTRSASIRNTNQLLHRYPLATGIKTGYTSESGYCLVASARKENRSVITVILGSGSREESFADAKSILNWALNRFDHKPIVRKNRRYVTLVRQGKTIPLIADRTITELVYNGEEAPVKFKIRTDKAVKLPIEKGEQLGKMSVTYMGDKIGSVELKAGRSVSSPYVVRNFSAYLSRIANKIRDLMRLIEF